MAHQRMYMAYTSADIHNQHATLCVLHATWLGIAQVVSNYMTTSQPFVGKRNVPRQQTNELSINNISNVHFVTRHASEFFLHTIPATTQFG